MWLTNSSKLGQVYWGVFGALYIQGVFSENVKRTNARNDFYVVT